MWLDDAGRRAELEQEFVRLHVDLKRDASARAAQAIIELLRRQQPAGGERVRSRIAGIDEAGRGPLAGPVVAAAVILRPRARHPRARRFEGPERRDAHAVARRDPPPRALLRDRLGGSGGNRRAQHPACDFSRHAARGARHARCPHKLSSTATACRASRAGRRAHGARHRRRRRHRACDQRRLDPRENRARSVYGSDGYDVSSIRLREPQGLCDARAPAAARGARPVPLASAQLRAGLALLGGLADCRGVGSRARVGARHRRGPRARDLPGAVRALSQFVHLRLHTEYSLVDGIVRVPELMAAVAAARMPAIALTDQSNLFAMVKFYKEALAAGVKPLDRRRCLDPRGGRAHAALAHRVPVPEPRGLPPSDAARDALVSRGTAARRADARARVARARDARGPDRALGRRRGRRRTSPRARQCGGGGALPRALAGVVRRSLLSRGAAHRARRRGALQRGGARSRVRARRAGGRHQRRALPHARGVRGARGAGMHPRGRAARRCEPARGATPRSNT